MSVESSMWRKLFVSPANILKSPTWNPFVALLLVSFSSAILPLVVYGGSITT